MAAVSHESGMSQVRPVVYGKIGATTSREKLMDGSVTFAWRCHTCNHSWPVQADGPTPSANHVELRLKPDRRKAARQPVAAVGYFRAHGFTE